MADVEFETSYGITVSSVLIARWPWVATIRFEHDGVVSELRFTDPRPFGTAMDALVECYQILIFDTKNQTQKEFGRYRIEIHGEDGCCADFTADGYEFETTDATASN